MMDRRTFVMAGCALVAYSGGGALAATAYPAKPIRLVVPFAPGGTVDLLARIVSTSLSQILGQAVVVDNKTGAGGAVGALEVIRSAPDGYSLLMASPSVTAANPAINPNAGYDPTRDLAAIVNVAASPTVLAVRSGLPAKTIQELIAELKRNPGRYTYGTPGVGGIAHLQMELFKSLTQTSIIHIPYRGAGPALLAVTSGQVDIIQDALPSVSPYLKDGRLVPLVIAAPARVSAFPQVPTFSEVGLAPLNAMSHYGILGPKALPKEIVDKINSAVREACQDPAVKRRIEDTGALVVASTPQEFTSEISTLFDSLKRVVTERKLSVE